MRKQVQEKKGKEGKASNLFSLDAGFLFRLARLLYYHSPLVRSHQTSIVVGDPLHGMKHHQMGLAFIHC